MNMRSGVYSASQCYLHIQMLMGLHAELKIIQEKAWGPNSLSNEELYRAEDAFDCMYKEFLRVIKRDFGTPSID